MDDATKERFEARARIMKAMAHPTRLFIVDELSRTERCVAELTDMIGGGHLHRFQTSLGAQKRGTRG